MKILFTGASSFTGCWFARQLAAAGHDVTATFQLKTQDYRDELRRERVALVARSCRAIHGVSFGDDAFLALLKEGGWDVVAHHAADATDYRSPNFDALRALERNCHNLSAVLASFASGGGKKVLLTGSVFERGEGAGSQGLPDFSPYGLSKALTAQVFRFYCDRARLSLGKFVIPNPFGPLEEPRYTAYLMKAWLAGDTPSCQSPLYVRDNIHVSLLAKAYVRFCEDLPAQAGFTRINPSGYPESQGAFTLRLAAEMRPRLQLPCAVELKQQTDFPEPKVRINTEPLDAKALGWNEAEAWDEMAAYYQQRSRR